jgi:hypothetical protein
LYGFILEGELEKIQALCRKVFHDPSGGATNYVPLSHYVMLTFGDIPKIIPKLEPFSTMGTTRERQVALWVLTAAVRQEGGVQIAERLAWFVPYMFVHNPISLAGGREIYGYAKNWGWIDMPWNKRRPNRFRLDTFGIETYNPRSQAEQVRLLEVTRERRRRRRKKGHTWRGLESAFGTITKVLEGEASPEGDLLVLPGLKLAENLFHDFIHREVPQVFLKQFRSVENGLAASSQAIVEAPTQVERLDGFSFLDRFSFDLHRVDSHPIADDLGLKSQDALLSFWLEMDFVLKDGSVIWRA